MVLRSNDLNVLPLPYLYPTHFSEENAVMILYQINLFILELFCFPLPTPPPLPNSFPCMVQRDVGHKEILHGFGRQKGRTYGFWKGQCALPGLPGTAGAHVHCCSFAGAPLGGSSRVVHGFSSNNRNHFLVLPVLHCGWSSITEGSKFFYRPSTWVMLKSSWVILSPCGIYYKLMDSTLCLLFSLRPHNSSQLPAQLPQRLQALHQT